MKKARPIIMSTRSVRLILAGNKTNTCRVIKPQPMRDDDLHQYESIYLQDDKWQLSYIVRPGKYQDVEISCPYGKQGDYLWVREAWSLKAFFPKANVILARYGANDSTRRCEVPRTERWLLWAQSMKRYVQLSPLFLPRWASRILLRVEAVAAKQLHKLSIGEIIHEGIKPYHGSVLTPTQESILRYKFMSYWDHLNAKRGFPYSSNPWVWSIEFNIAEVKK